MSADSRRMGRIRGYRDAGITVGQHDVDWLIAEVERLTAERDRYKEWCDGVAAQKVVDAVDIGTACGAMRRQNGRVIELQDAIDEIERASVKAIVRPQPLKENE